MAVVVHDADWASGAVRRVVVIDAKFLGKTVKGGAYMV